jgi:hypothetical protein
LERLSTERLTNPSTRAWEPPSETRDRSSAGVTTRTIPSTPASVLAARTMTALLSAFVTEPPGVSSRSTAGTARAPVACSIESYARELSEFGSLNPKG